MNKRDIEKRIAELNALITVAEKIDNDNQAVYHAAQKELHDSLLKILTEAGFPVNEETRVSAYAYGEPKNRQVSVQFKNHSDYNVDFRGRKLVRFSTSGISSHGTDSLDDLVKVQPYYDMVNRVNEKLTSQYFDSNMQVFFDTIENFKSPDLKNDLNAGEYRRQIVVLEDELRVLDLELEVGKAVQFQYKSTGGRWSRTYWADYTVEKMTAKTVVLIDRFGDRKVVSRNDVHYKIRKPEVKAS